MTKASDNPFPSVLLAEQGSAPTTPDTGKWRLYTKSDGLYVVDDAGTETGPLAAAVSSSSEAYLLYREEQTAGTAGGTFTSGDWRTRALNTETADAGGHGSVSSSQVTLAAGTYRFRAWAIGFRCGLHKLRLQNITDATTVAVGSSSHADQGTDGSGTHSFVEGRFTIAGSKAFELQHRCETTVATNGMGVASNFSVVEVYAALELWKEL